jgi:predicted GNAT family acetyltransferase
VAELINKKKFFVNSLNLKMEIKQEQTQTKGVFYVEDDKKRLAEMEYSLTDNNLMIINHTEVDEILKGKNVGYQLVNAAVEYARANHLKFFPLCPFANAVMKKKKTEYADVLRR